MFRTSVFADASYAFSLVLANCGIAFLDALEWQGVDREKYEALCEDLGFGRLASLPHKWSDGS